MRFETTKAKLQDGLGTISGAVSSSSSLEVLEHVLLQAEEDKLKLKATDLELSLETSIDVNISQTGSCSVPAQKFQNLIQALPSSKTSVEFEVSNEQMDITVSETNANFQLPALPEDEFPDLPEPEEEELKFSIEAEELADRLRDTQFATSTDSTRGYLGGVLFELDREDLTLVATDSHRMALQEVNLEAEGAPDSSTSILIPVKGIRELVKTMPEDARVRVTSDGNLVEFNFGSTRLISRLIDEEFPDYQRVIPEEYEQRIELSTARLLDAVKRVTLLADEKTKRLMLEFGTDELTLKAEDTEEGAGEEKISIDYGGEKISIAFNGEYLADVLKHVPDDEIYLDLISSDSPGTFRPMERNDYLYIVMPMRLS